MAKAYTEIIQSFTVDDHRAKLDGVGMEIGPNSWGVADYTLPEPLHLNEAHVRWSGCSLGDYGYSCLLHPGSFTTLGADALVGATQVDVGAWVPYYTPANGATMLELWSADGLTLLEIHPIQGVSGNMVVFDGTSLALARDTSINVKARYGSFSPCRGENLLEGGIPFHCENGVFSLKQVYAVTAIIPPGMIISSRVKTTSDIGTRCVTVSFLFRSPVVEE